nr:unnamed protein product [Spirometra erinaceieuropaei]
MAEAHSAVAFSFAVTSEGLTYDLNTEVLRALAKSTIESWKHSASRLKNSIYSKFYPFHVTSWFIFAVAVFLASFFDVYASRYPVAVIENFLKQHCGLTLSYHMFGYHIAVYHRGRYFKCPFVVEGRYLLPTELEAMFESILGDVSEPAAGEKRLGALTAGPRDDWAMARKSFFSSGVNRTSLNAIEKSAFLVVLDEEAFGNDYKNINAFAKSALCGKCCDRWFDKSFALIVYKDAKFAANSEHSWADAPVTSHAVESCLVHEFHYNAIREPYLHYVNGHCDGEPKKVLAPIRLHWKIPEQCISVIESSYSIARDLADSVDLVVKRFESFGKRIPKLFGLSPDSFVQMALQLAYFMEKKRFCLTYESSMVRMFREGRTDTVRSCSSASCEFVEGFLDPNLPVESKRSLLKTACDQHQRLYRDAMVGKGVDRHLFALYVVSKFLKSDSPFLKETTGMAFRVFSPVLGGLPPT